MVNKKYVPDRGDIVWLDFNPQTGKEQAGLRPALVLSGKIYNRTGLMIACPITSKVKGYPFEILVSTGKITGAVLADHIKNQDWQARKIRFITKAPKDVQNRVFDSVLALLMH